MERRCDDLMQYLIDKIQMIFSSFTFYTSALAVVHGDVCVVEFMHVYFAKIMMLRMISFSN